MKVVIFFIFACVLTPPMESRTVPLENEDSNFWMKLGKSDLLESLTLEPLRGKARNVIIFIGDGMGMSTITAARIFKGQSEGQKGEEYSLSFEKFPSVGLLKTYNVDKQVPDSAGTATAIFTGVKSNYYMIGFDANAPFNICDPEANKRSTLTSVMQWAQEAGKGTGFVTTTRVTHATPAALYSHVNHRDWECDGEIPKEYRTCIKDVARQLVEDSPGKNFKVILGGGWNPMGVTREFDEDESCIREDGRNIINEWQHEKFMLNSKYMYVNDTKSLMDVDVDNVDYLLGIFSVGHVPYKAVRSRGSRGQPSLVDMTTKAIKMLQKEENGYVLMVEGGRIDHGHHENYARLALMETSELDDAIKKALSLTERKDTLIIVTADHSHAFTINGYPNRGNDILGFANQTKHNFAYETLSYANGPSYFYHRLNDSKGPNDTWRDVADDASRGETFYQHFAPIYLDDETHAGEDVPIYAQGPQAHLFQGVHEQSYIAHVVSYASCIGPHHTMCSSAISSALRLLSKTYAIFIPSVAILFVI